MTVRSDLSGGPSHLNTLLQGLDKVAQHNIYVAAPDNEYFSNSYKSQAKKLFNMPTRFFSLFVFFRLIGFIKDNNINIIHSHGRGAGLYSRLLKLFTPVKVIHTFHGVHPATNFIGLVKLWMDIALRFLADHYIYVTANEFQTSKSTHTHFGDYSIIHNGVDVDKLLSDVSKFKRLDVLNEFKLPTDKIIITSILRNDPIKGCAQLIDKFNTFANANFILVLAGVTKEEVGEHRNIYPIGSTKGPESILAITDIYVSHSLSEGLPLSVIEAASIGAKILLSNIPGHKLFFQKGIASSFTTQEEFSKTLLRFKQNLEKVENTDFDYLEMAKKTNSIYTL